MTTQTLVLSHRYIDLQQIFRDRYKNKKNRENCEVKVNLETNNHRITNRMVRRRLSLPFTDVKENDEVIADEEINNWKWKSYHEIDVKQNMGNGRYIHKIIQNNYNAKICQYIFWITMAAVPTNLL